MLFSREYEEQKMIYSDGIIEALAFINTQIEKALTSQQHRAFLSFVSVIVVLIMSFSAWISVLRLTGSYLDQHNRMESDLRQNRGFLDNIIENLPSMIFIKDAKDLRYVRINKAVEDLIGYSSEELLGKNDYDFFPKEEADFFTQKDREVLSQRRLLDVPEESIQTRLFGERILHTKKIPLMDKEGHPEYLLGISEDITEQKHAENELIIFEKERIKSQKIESIGALAGGIAHDFNNLLQGVFGYISLAKLRINDPDRCTQLLDEAETALHKTVKLTNQLLTFSKGGKPLRKTVRILPIIETAVKFALSGSNLTYAITADEDLWNVSVDEDQIGQVVHNITLNAEQSMADGGKLQIEARNVNISGKDIPTELANGKYVEISIADTGTGIAEEHLDRIFEPYFTTKKTGSGLGLATSFAIIKNHNGTIKVSSKLARGTTFRIYLPFSEETPQDDQAKAVPEDSVTQGRVLVMDDEEVVLTLAREFLTALGHEVETARDGEEAVRIFKAAQDQGKNFDLVILDLTIRGGLGGVETIKKLIALDADVKAIVSSGYSDDAAIANYKQQGFRAVLKKPYRINELRDTLNEVL